MNAAVKGYRPQFDLASNWQGEIDDTTDSDIIAKTSIGNGMRFRRFRFAVYFGRVALAHSLGAHHSFSAEFDARQPTTFEGGVTKIEWTNPHVYFYADVKGRDGQAVNWAFQTAGPNFLTRLGWDRNSLRAGDHVTVVGYPARGGANVASARSVVLSGERKIFTGSAVDGGPQK